MAGRLWRSPSETSRSSHSRGSTCAEDQRQLGLGSAKQTPVGRHLTRASSSVCTEKARHYE